MIRPVLTYSSFKALSLLVFMLGFMSCSNDDNRPLSSDLKSVNVNIDICIDEQPWQSPATRANTTVEANALTLTVFDGNGKSVFTKSQTKAKDASNFGSIPDIRLAPGTYKFAVVAHYSTDGSDEATKITSPTLASIPVERLYNTHAAVKEVTVSDGDYSSQSVNMSVPLCVTSLNVITNDHVPAEVSKVRLTINEGGTPATSPILVNPTTGLATTNLSYSRIWDVTPSIGKELSVTVNALLNEYPKTVSVKIEALNSDESEVLFSRTFFSDITMKLATHHVLKTNLFTTNSNTSLSFDGWAEKIEEVTIE